MSDAERKEWNEDQSERDVAIENEQLRNASVDSSEDADEAVSAEEIPVQATSETEESAEIVEMEESKNLEEPIAYAETVEIVTSNENEEKAQYEYRWDYAAQKSFDENEKKKNRKRGAWTYAIVMASAFLLCFAMLAGVLIWYGVTGRKKQAYGSLSANEVTERVSPSTVLIYTKRSDGSYSSGTGFFIRSDGYIATNYHVVEKGKEFEVTLYSAKRVSAELVGSSKENDLAVLKIKGSGYPTVILGNSDAVKVGDTAFVIGNPNGAYGAWTTTQGIISAVDRQSTINNKACRMLQTDAAINPGNSGGPLCNDRGEVIGVVTQIMLDQEGERSEGFGLAIPINKAAKILEEIISKGQ